MKTACLSSTNNFIYLLKTSNPHRYDTKISPVQLKSKQETLKSQAQLLCAGGRVCVGKEKRSRMHA